MRKLKQGSGIRDQGSGNRDQGIGIRDQGIGIRDQGSGALFLHSPFPVPRSPVPCPQSPFPILYLLFAICFLFLASCATAPKAGTLPEDGAPDFSVLPPGANICLWADVKQSKPILESMSFAGFEGKDAGRLMDLTNTAVAAFYPESASRSFFMAGWGDYPKLGSGIAMGFSRDWKKKKSETGKRYWHSKSNNIGVAIGSDLVFASDGDPFGAGSAGDPAPRGFEEFRRPCVLSLWWNDPGVPLNRITEAMGLPVQIPAEDLFLGVMKSASNTESNRNWILVFRIRTQSASHARSMLSLVSMARIFLQRVPKDEKSGVSVMSPQAAAAILFANQPEQDGDSLIIKTDPIGERVIALLFNLFPLYSD